MKGNKKFTVKRNSVFCTMKYNNHYYVGEAKRAESDTFNVEYGKAVAQIRADILLREVVRIDALNLYASLNSSIYRPTPIVHRHLLDAARELKEATYFLNRQKKLLKALLHIQPKNDELKCADYLVMAQMLATNTNHAEEAK